MEDDTMAIVLALVAGSLLIGLYSLTGWWARREKRLRDERPTSAAPAPDASIAKHLQPTWSLLIVVALVAGAAGAAMSRLLGTGDADLRKKVEELRGDVDDVRDAVVRLQRGY